MFLLKYTFNVCIHFLIMYAYISNVYASEEIFKECFLPAYFPILLGEQVSELHNYSVSSRHLIWHEGIKLFGNEYEGRIVETEIPINYAIDNMEVISHVAKVGELVADIQTSVFEFLDDSNIFEFSGVWLCSDAEVCSLSNTAILDDIVRIAMHEERGYYASDLYELLLLTIVSETNIKNFLSYKVIIKYSSAITNGCLTIINEFIKKESGLCSSLNGYKLFRLRIGVYKYKSNIRRLVLTLNHSGVKTHTESLVSIDGKSTSIYAAEYGSYEDMAILKRSVDNITNEGSNIVQVCAGPG